MTSSRDPINGALSPRTYRIFLQYHGIARKDFFTLVTAIDKGIATWAFNVPPTFFGHGNGTREQPPLGTIQIKDFPDLVQARQSAKLLMDIILKEPCSPTVEFSFFIWCVWWQFCSLCQQDRLHRQQVKPEVAQAPIICWAGDHERPTMEEKDNKVKDNGGGSLNECVRDSKND